MYYYDYIQGGKSSFIGKSNHLNNEDMKFKTNLGPG